MLYNLRHWPFSTTLKFIYKYEKKIFQAKKKPFLLIACFPRSASNFLAYSLSESTGYIRESLNRAPGFFHDTIDLPKLIDLMLRKAIVTQHLRATSLTRSIIVELNIKPIILVRNIFDVVISYNDYISQRGYGPLDPDRKDLVPEYCSNYSNFDDSKKYDYLIDIIIPWYISFYVSWYHYTINTNEIKAYWLKYEDLVTNPKSKLLEIFEFYNISVLSSHIDSILAQNKKINFNKGISGRGNLLTQSQKERIKKITDYHTNIDFSLIGL